MARAEPIEVGAGDERRHAPTADPLWSESFYANFFDRNGVLGGFARVALHPARGVSEGQLCLYLPGGGIGAAVTTGWLKQPNDSTTTAGALAHVLIDPLRQWCIRFDGELHVFEDPASVARASWPNPRSEVRRHVYFNLEATGLHRPFFYPGYTKVAAGPPHRSPRPIGIGRRLKRAMRRPAEVLSALNMRKARHYEQSMAVRGSVVIDDERFAFDGSGHRDHSWGPRDYMPSERWRWLTGQLDGLAFNAMYLTIAGMHVINGYVWNGDACSPLERVEMTTTFEDSGVAAREIALQLTAGGVTYLIKGDVDRNVSAPLVGKHYFSVYSFGRALYRCGDRRGYGAAEFLERLDP